MTRSFVSICLLVLLLAGSGCAGNGQFQNELHFYTLEYDAPAVTDCAPVPAVIRVDTFGVAPAYNSDRIIYREGTFQRDAYFYHRWRANPGILVAGFLERDLEHSGLFAAVVTENSKVQPGYWIEGHVEEFLEWDRNEGWEAVLAVNVVLVADTAPERPDDVLFQKTFRAQKPCASKKPQALAKAMSEAMAEVSKAVMGDVCRHLTDHKAGRAGSFPGKRGLD